MNRSKLFVIGVVRMDLSEYLDWKESHEEEDLERQWGEDNTCPPDEEEDETANKRWRD